MSGRSRSDLRARSPYRTGLLNPVLSLPSLSYWLDYSTLASGATSWSPSLDTAGAGAAVFGSSAGADSADPTVTTVSGRPLLLFDGVNDYATVPNAALPSAGTSASVSIVAVYRQNGTPPSAAITSAKVGFGDNEDGHAFEASGTTVYSVWGDGAANSTLTRTGSTANLVNVASSVLTPTTHTFRLNGSTTSAARVVGDASSATGLLLGRLGASFYANIGLIAVLIGSAAWTSDQLASVETHYGAGT
jgi:hypothetical protein